MATVAEDSGFETVTCEISGEVSAFGITIKGSYKKGNRYSISFFCFQNQWWSKKEKKREKCI